MPLPHRFREDYPYWTPAIEDQLKGFDIATIGVVGHCLEFIWDVGMPYEQGRARDILEGKRGGGEAKAEEYEKDAELTYADIRAGSDINVVDEVATLKGLIGEEKTNVILEELIRLHKQKAPREME